MGYKVSSVMSLSSIGKSIIGKTEDSDSEERMKRFRSDNKSKEECNAEQKKIN